MKNHKGFSLLELMICVTMVVILFVLVVPQFSFFKRYFLYREQDCLCATLSYLQSKAIASGKPQSFLYNIEQNSYHYDYPSYHKCSYRLHHGVTFGFLPGTKGPPGNPTKIIHYPVTFENVKAYQKDPHIIFLPQGTTSQSGTIYLIDKHQKTMAAVTVGIGQGTTIKKYRYASNKWSIA